MSEQLQTHLGDNTGQYSRELSQRSSEGLRSERHPFAFPCQSQTGAGRRGLGRGNML